MCPVFPSFFLNFNTFSLGFCLGYEFFFEVFDLCFTEFPLPEGLGVGLLRSPKEFFRIVLSFFLIARSTIEFTSVDISSFSGGWEAAQAFRTSAVAAVAWISVSFWSHVFTSILVIFLFGFYGFPAKVRL